MSAAPGDVEVRPLAEGESGAWWALVASGFHQPRPTDEDLPRWRRRFAGHRMLVAVADGRMVGSYRSFATTLTLPGGTGIRANAVSGVTVLPTHRRRGVLTRMITADLAAAAERGDPVSVLIASEAPIYGRFGFGPAVDAADWALDTSRADLRPSAAGSDAGTVELIEPAQLRVDGPEVYTAARAGQPGAIDRDAAWWDDACDVDPPPGGPDRQRMVALHRDAGGRPTGYLTYRVDGAWEDRVPRGTLVVRDLVTATDAAYCALWRFAAGVDWVRTVRAENRSVAEALPLLLQDPRAARQVARSDFLWVRVHDPVTALSARRYAGPGVLVLDVADPTGTAAGRFALDVDADGAATVQRAARSAAAAPVDVQLPVATLGALFLGGAEVATLARAGWVQESRPGGLGRAHRLLRSLQVPWCGTWF